MFSRPVLSVDIALDVHVRLGQRKQQKEELMMAKPQALRRALIGILVFASMGFIYTCQAHAPFGTGSV